MKQYNENDIENLFEATGKNKIRKAISTQNQLQVGDKVKIKYLNAGLDQTTGEGIIKKISDDDGGPKAHF